MDAAIPARNTGEQTLPARNTGEQTLPARNTGEQTLPFRDTQSTSGDRSRSSRAVVDGGISALGTFDQKEAKLSRDKSSANTFALVPRYNGENLKHIWLQQMPAHGACA